MQGLAPHVTRSRIDGLCLPDVPFLSEMGQRLFVSLQSKVGREDSKRRIRPIRRCEKNERVKYLLKNGVANCLGNRKAMHDSRGRAEEHVHGFVCKVRGREMPKNRFNVKNISQTNSGSFVEGPCLVVILILTKI